MLVACQEMGWLIRSVGAYGHLSADQNATRVKSASALPGELSRHLHQQLAILHSFRPRAMDKRSISVIAGGVLLRLLLFTAFPSLPTLLGHRVEISTPVTSFKRLQEGLFLYTHGVSPYDGGVFHQVCSEQSFVYVDLEWFADVGW